MKKNAKTEEQYWNKFYSNYKNTLPSQFCILCASEIPNDNIIIEFGCGNGRDSIFLAQLGYNIKSFDLSEEAIKRNTDATQNLENISFTTCDAADHSTVSSEIKSIKSLYSDKKIAVYARFFLHTLDSKQEDIFLRSLSETLTSGDKLYFEFRSLEDAQEDKVFDNHYRRYIVVKDLIDTLENTHKFKVDYSVVGQGMAKFGDEDPFVARLISEKI
jgi:SAM-dependent methyltransferase